VEHGTNKGYYKHYRQGSKPCEQCRKAHNAYAYARKHANDPPPALELFRQRNADLEPAIVAAYHGRATEAQSKQVQAWYEAAWGISQKTKVTKPSKRF